MRRNKIHAAYNWAFGNWPRILSCIKLLIEITSLLGGILKIIQWLVSLVLAVIFIDIGPVLSLSVWTPIE